MKIETIKQRIENAESKLEKLNGTLERHTSQLNKKAKVLTDKGLDLNTLDRFQHRQTETYWDICAYEDKLEDIKNTNKKIKETNKSLEELKEQLEKQTTIENENNNIIPEVLNIFLENWKQKCFEYFTNLANEYIEVQNKKYEINEEELEGLYTEKYDRETRTYISIRKYDNEEISKILNGQYPEYRLNNIKSEIKRRYINLFKKCHFASDIAILETIIDYDNINNDRLNKILDDDVKIKKEQFINRIKEVIGEIKDLSGLKIGSNSELNGIAIGVKANAKVETITAGGYNIQCYHFRVLVNTVK